MKYKVTLENFEGPFDLLFHLIEKSKVDIYDISIAEITNQYIDYIKKMEELDLEITSEFLIMSATLLEIKSKTLLPKEEDEGVQLEMDEVDPREQLINKLLEYKKYKDVAQKFKLNEEKQKNVYYKHKEEIDQFIDTEEPVLEGIQLQDLIKAFDKVLIKANKKTTINNIREIQREEISIDDCMNQISKTIEKQNTTQFHQLFSNEITKTKIVVLFLALLELIKLKKVIIKQENNFDSIIIKKNNNLS